VIEARLEITPEPKSLKLVRTHSQSCGIARFSGRSRELCFESTVRLEHSPLDTADLDLEDAARTFPVVYSTDEMPDLACCIDRHQPDPGTRLATGSSIPAPQWVDGPFELLTRLSQGINHGFRYRRREAKESSHQWRRSGSAMAAAAILPCC